jgi:hypothetical protein
MFDSCQVNTDSGPVLTLSCIFPLLASIIFWLFVFSGTIAVIVIIISGIRLIISGGEAKTVEVAKKWMTYAITGLILVLLSFMILNIIAYVTGVACISKIAGGIPTFQSCHPSSGGSGRIGGY